MTIYAKDTTVSSERSRGEIEHLLQKYGAEKFGYMWEGTSAVIVFEMKNRRVKFVLPLPDKQDQKFFQTATGRTRKNPNASFEAWEQECRSRWRALTLCIKAKLESVESEIETFEEAWLSHILLPDGATVFDHVAPKVEAAYRSGKMPRFLLGSGEEKDAVPGPRTS